MSVHVFYKVYSDSLLARTLNLRGNQFAIISENQVLTNISGSTLTVFQIQIQQNGVLQQWQYRPDSSWKFVSEQNILTSQGACVTDVCLNVAQNSLYWCEGSQTEGGGRPMYCICKRQMSEGNC